MKISFNQVPSNFPKASKDRVSNPRFQGGRVFGSLSDITTMYLQCGKKHVGKCFKGMYSCFYCGKSGHKVKSHRMARVQGKESNQAQESCPNSDAPKNNHIYALRSRGDQKVSPDVVSNML